MNVPDAGQGALDAMPKVDRPPRHGKAADDDGGIAEIAREVAAIA